MSKDNKILMGVISGPHGVKGLVKVRSYTENPKDIFAYGTLYDETLTREFCLTLKGSGKDCFLTAVKGCENRNKAEELKGTKLYVKKESLPELEEETFWHDDLIGMEVKDKAGKLYGKVAAVYNFGAGDILDVKADDAKSVMIPFTKAEVPEVNVGENHLIISDTDWFLSEGEKTDV